MVPPEASCPHPGRAPSQLSGMAVWPVPEELVTARGVGWTVGGPRRLRADTPPPARGKLQHNQSSGPNFPQIRLSAEKSARSWGDAQDLEGPPTPPPEPPGLPGRALPAAGAGGAWTPLGRLRLSGSRASSGRVAGSAGPGSGARAARGTHRFLGGSLRSRARGARGPPGRWRRRWPGSGDRGDEPARESSGGHGPGRAVHGGPPLRPGRRSGPPPRARLPPPPPRPLGAVLPAAPPSPRAPDCPDRARGRSRPARRLPGTVPGARPAPAPPASRLSFLSPGLGRRWRVGSGGSLGTSPGLPARLPEAVHPSPGWVERGARVLPYQVAILEWAPWPGCGGGRREVGGPTISPSAAPYPCSGPWGQ